MREILKANKEQSMLLERLQHIKEAYKAEQRPSMLRRRTVPSVRLLQQPQRSAQEVFDS